MGITRTKIICTIGPATKDLAVLRKLYKAGMNVVRINMSHADHVFAKNIIDKVKKINSDKNSLGFSFWKYLTRFIFGEIIFIVNPKSFSSFNSYWNKIDLPQK